MSNLGLDFSSLSIAESRRTGETLVPIGEELHVWRLCRPAFKGDLRSLYNELSVGERKRAMNLTYACEREDFVLGRGFLRRILSRYTGVAGKELEFGCNAHGKPFLATPGLDLEFSSAQSGNEQVFVFTAGKKIGVDIEFIDFRIDELSLALHHFSALEVDRLGELPIGRRIAGFYRTWTQKEAYMKALGLGYAFSSRNFSVEVDPRSPPGLVSSSRSADPTRFHFHEIEIGRGYSCTVAVGGPARAVRLFSAF